MYLVGNYEGWIMGRNRLWVAKISGSPFDKAKIVSRLLKKSFYLYYKYNLKKIWNFDLKSFRNILILKSKNIHDSGIFDSNTDKIL